MASLIVGIAAEFMSMASSGGSARSCTTHLACLILLPGWLFDSSCHLVTLPMTDILQAALHALPATCTQLAGLRVRCHVGDHAKDTSAAAARASLTACLLRSGCSSAQAHAGYSGSPDADPNPMFTQVASNLQIKNWSLTVTLPPVSLTVVAF